MNSRYVIIAVVGILLIAGGGFFLWNTFGNKVETPPPQTPVEQVPQDSTYASSTIGISFSYPKTFTLDDKYVNSSFGPKKLIQGVKVTIPAQMATGTNLSSDSGVSFEWLPNARNCTGDIYLQANVKAQKITDNGVEYSVASSSGAAAGNLYEEIIYARVGSTPCTAVRYYIHSSNIGNYPAGAVREFDRAALLQAFDKIRQSLIISR